MQLLVENLENGTVIDRIGAFRGIEVLRILQLVPPEGKMDPETSGADTRIALVINVPSKRIGRKDILKIEGRRLGTQEVNRIALICPQARLNIIENGKVVEKKDVKLPRELVGVARCPNPRCISNESRVDGHFAVEPEGIRCRYCERRFHANELVL